MYISIRNFQKNDQKPPEGSWCGYGDLQRKPDKVALRSRFYRKDSENRGIWKRKKFCSEVERSLWDIVNVKPSA